MSTKTEHRLCTCCALWIANRDESSCRDYHGHTHPRPNDNIGVVDTSSEPDHGPDTWNCDGCDTTQLPGAAAWTRTSRHLEGRSTRPTERNTK